VSDINLILNKVKKFARRQQLVDSATLLLFTLATTIISISVALLLLKSPLFGIIGLIPLFFYRPASFIKRAKILEEKIGLKGELVNSIQLSFIKEDNKERYSPELINAYISDATEKIKKIDFRKYISYTLMYSSLRFLLIAIIFALLHPAIHPGHFWYSLNHKIFYTVEPGTTTLLKGSTVQVKLCLNGVYLPKSVRLFLTENQTTIKKKLAVQDGLAQDNIKLQESLAYHFAFLEHTSEQYFLKQLEPAYIKELTFLLKYPVYTKLKDDVKTGRQLIVPEGTKVTMNELKCEDKTFAAEFKVKESGTAFLYLKSTTEIKEQIVLYAVPDLPPLVDIFYPGFNIQLPHDMQIDISIRCSDDYGLTKALFHYNFENKREKTLPIKQGAIEDTVYFVWDMSDLGMLPGDEVSYFAEIIDNAGKVSKSEMYYIYFPTMEEIYEEIDRKEELVQRELEDLQVEHADEMDEISRLHEKIMRERQLLWADQEKLRTAISKEQKILEKIDAWQTEFEKTIEKLNQGVLLDQESIEHLQEIARILQEIAPDELRKALENLQTALNKRPQDIQMALEDLKKKQEEIAKAIKRTLEILKRFQQEEKLKELAQMADELAEQAEEIDQALKQEEIQALQQEIDDLKKAISELGKELQELADAEGLEQDMKQALEELAQQTQDMTGDMSPSPGEMQKGLKMMTAELQRLYEKLTKGRTAQLRKKLLDIVNQT
jgi:ABC-type transporter Mla subunit MlaD